MGLFSKKIYFNHPLNMGNLRKNLEHIEKQAWDAIDLSAVAIHEALLIPFAGEVYLVQHGIRLGRLPHDKDFDRILGKLEHGDYYDSHSVWIVYANERENAIAVEIKLDE